MNSKIYYLLAWILIILGGIITLFYLILIGKDGWGYFGVYNIDIDKSGSFGDYIGGFVGTIFSLAGFIFLFLTLREQRISFQKERFETRLFEMIKWHRDNVHELRYSFYDYKFDKDGRRILVEDTATSKKVFRVIWSDFELLNNELKFLFNISELEIYTNNYLNKLNDNKLLNSRNINLVTYAKIDIIYCILFFGLSKEGIEVVKAQLFNRYIESFIESVIKIASLKPKIYSKYWGNWVDFNNETDENKYKIYLEWTDINSHDYGIMEMLRFEHTTIRHRILFSEIVYDKYYGGHQFRLAHYFTHLYQLIRYIDSNVLLSTEDKYDNAKLIRAQLSAYEQLLFFVNSISILGRGWELEDKNNGAESIPYELISKYKLIKNIATDEIINELKVTSFYPTIFT